MFFCGPHQLYLRPIPRIVSNQVMLTEQSAETRSLQIASRTADNGLGNPITQKRFKRSNLIQTKMGRGSTPGTWSCAKRGLCYSDGGTQTSLSSNHSKWVFVHHSDSESQAIRCAVRYKLGKRRLSTLPRVSVASLADLLCLGTRFLAQQVFEECL